MVYGSARASSRASIALLGRCTVSVSYHALALDEDSGVVAKQNNNQDLFNISAASEFTSAEKKNFIELSFAKLV